MLWVSSSESTAIALIHEYTTVNVVVVVFEYRAFVIRTLPPRTLVSWR